MPRFTDDETVAAAVDELRTEREPGRRLALVQHVRNVVGIPAGAREQRDWIHYHLKQKGHGWTAAEIAERNGASTATVSRVFLGDLRGGTLGNKVRRETASILGLPVDVLWPPLPTCPTCGQPVRDVAQLERATNGNGKV